MDQLDRTSLDKLLVQAAHELKANADEFARLDSLFGDGDHGVSMSNIAEFILTNVERNVDLDIKAHLDSTGADIMNMGGGSSSFLWGALFQGLATGVAPQQTHIDPACLAAMFGGALTEMCDVTTARVGDKTLMDTLFPAVEAGLAAAPSATCIEDILKAVANGAIAGRDFTISVAAKFGRAKNYKDQSIGTPDAGAVSMAVFFCSLAK